MPDVAIIDYGSGNVRSMLNALRRVAREDQRVVLTKDPSLIVSAERLVVPGVGAFGEVRRKLDRSGVLPAVEAVKQSGRAVLGVCVGMQVLADEGREFESVAGLGWIHGVVKRLEVEPACKLPHFGWSPVKPREGSALFEGLPQGTQFYFVHSFAFACESTGDVDATAEYSVEFTSAVRHQNLAGTQFHPEKSDAAGLRFLSNFCRWTP